MLGLRPGVLRVDNTCRPGGGREGFNLREDSGGRKEVAGDNKLSHSTDLPEQHSDIMVISMVDSICGMGM